MDENELTLGDPEEEGKATPDAEKPDATPAGDKGDESKGAKPDTSDEDDDDKKKIRNKADLLDALHDPEQAEYVWPMIVKNCEKLGIDIRTFLGETKAEAAPAKAEPVKIDLSDIGFDDGKEDSRAKGMFSGTDKEMLDKVSEKFGTVVGSLQSQIKALETKLTAIEEPVGRLKPVVEREQLRADRKTVITAHGDQAKARLAKDYGITVNRQTLEDAFDKNPRLARNADGLVAAVVMLKAKPTQQKGPEFAGRGTGAERPDPKDLDSLVANVVRDLGKGR